MKRIVLSWLILSLSCAASAEETRRLGADVLWELSRLAAPVVSPDGKRVVVAATTYPEKDDPEKTYQPETRLWLLATQPGTKQRPLTAEGRSASDAVFSADGSSLAFVGKGNGDDAAQIYVLPMDGPGEAVRLTDVPTGASAPKWVGDYIYFISNVWPDKSFDEMAEKIKADKDSKLSAKVWNEMPYAYWDKWLDEERQNHLYRVPAAGGEVEALTLGTGMQLPHTSPGTGDYDVSRDGKRLAFVADSRPAAVYPDRDVFFRAPSLPEQRQKAGAVRLADGRVLLVGGALGAVQARDAHIGDAQVARHLDRGDVGGAQTLVLRLAQNQIRHRVVNQLVDALHAGMKSHGGPIRQSFKQPTAIRVNGHSSSRSWPTTSTPSWRSMSVTTRPLTRALLR